MYYLYVFRFSFCFIILNGSTTWSRYSWIKYFWTPSFSSENNPLYLSSFLLFHLFISSQKCKQHSPSIHSKSGTIALLDFEGKKFSNYHLNSQVGLWDKNKLNYFIGFLMLQHDVSFNEQPIESIKLYLMPFSALFRRFFFVLLNLVVL